MKKYTISQKLGRGKVAEKKNLTLVQLLAVTDFSDEEVDRITDLEEGEHMALVAPDSDIVISRIE
jgi:hypothetical protein